MRGLVLAVLLVCMVFSCAIAEEETPVDLDLTFMNGNMLYAQVWQMMETPDEYAGAIVRVAGKFSYCQDPDTGKEYFAALIPDAAACCAQGMEFIWEGEHVYPEDYPEVGKDILVTGRFETYEENGYLYIQLADAELIWTEEQSQGNLLSYGKQS